MDWFRLYQRANRQRMKDGLEPLTVDQRFHDYGNEPTIPGTHARKYIVPRQFGAYADD